MRRWLIPGGHIPLDLNGGDYISFLNLGDKTDALLFIYHQDRNCVGPYKVQLKAWRVCKLSLSELIDPEALILDEPYSVEIQTSKSVIVQFSRRDSTHSHRSLCGGISYSQE